MLYVVRWAGLVLTFQKRYDTYMLVLLMLSVGVGSKLPPFMNPICGQICRPSPDVYTKNFLSFAPQSCLKIFIYPDYTILSLLTLTIQKGKICDGFLTTLITSSPSLLKQMLWILFI